jgi:hypothetical protein
MERELIRRAKAGDDGARNRRAAIVPGLKPIEPDDAETSASGRVERGAPHSAKTDNRHVISLHFNRSAKAASYDWPISSTRHTSLF